jgi:CheY-like chemotaxis protein
MILVVHRKKDRRDALKAVLESAGHDVSATHDGVDALKLAIDVKWPDIALIDMALPGLGGYGLAKGLRNAAEGRRLHLIAMTGQSHDRERALDSGFDMHITTPIDSGALLEIIASLRSVDEPAA